MNVHDRLKLVVKYLVGQGVAGNQEKLGELLGYSNKASFSHILNNRKPLPSDFIDRLALLDRKVNRVWILSGEGEMLNNTEVLESDKPISNNDLSSYLMQQISEKDKKIDELNKYVGKLENLLDQNGIDYRDTLDKIKKGAV